MKPTVKRALWLALELVFDWRLSDVYKAAAAGLSWHTDNCTSSLASAAVTCWKRMQTEMLHRRAKRWVELWHKIASNLLVLAAQQPQNIRLPVMRCDMWIYSISLKELKIAERLKKTTIFKPYVSYSVCILVTITSLQRAEAVQNNRPTACRDLIKPTVMPNTPLTSTRSRNRSILNPRELNSLYF